MQKDAHDHGNPRATVGLVIYYPFQFYVYRHVYKHIADRAEFIVDLGLFYPARQPEGLLADIVGLLDRHGATYRVLQYEDYRYGSYMERFLDRYDVIVSVWLRGSLQIPYAQTKKLVHLTYGAGKELTTFGLHKRVFDLILAYGEYDHAFYSLITKSVIVGNPKFDDWFDNTLDMESISDVAHAIDSAKQTVLYLPTHSDLSSIDELADALKRLGDSYNVIAKLHYYTPREEPERVEKLTDPRILLLKDDTDLLPLLKSADVVVSDNSSAIFDAILADKPVIVADFTSPEFLDTEHRTFKVRRRGITGALTYSGSIEQRIKKEGIVQTLGKPDELPEMIERVLSHDDKKAERAALRDQLFSFNDGRAGERAAAEILAVLETPKPKSRPFLYHAIESYTAQVLRQPSRTVCWVEEYLPARTTVVQNIEEKEKGVVFSILWLPSALPCAADSFRSLLEQHFPSARTEIVAIGRSEIDVQTLMSSMPSTLGTPSVITIGSGRSSILSEQVAEALSRANGRIICFVTDDCVLSSDWLMVLYGAYERHPGVGGVGGYVCAAPEVYSSFDGYRYREIAKRLNIRLVPGFLASLYEVTNQLAAQNPAGALSAMSYRRDALPRLARLLTVSHLERYVRDAVIATFPLCFIPHRVTRLSPLEKDDFLHAEYEQGYADTLRLKRRNGFQIVLIDAWRFLHLDRRVLMQATILAWMMRRLGRIQARLAVWMGDIAVH